MFQALKHHNRLLLVFFLITLITFVMFCIVLFLRNTTNSPELESTESQTETGVVATESPDEALQENEALQFFYRMRGENYPEGEDNYLKDRLGEHMCSGIFSEKSAISLGNYYAERIVESVPDDNEWEVDSRTGLKEDWVHLESPDNNIVWDMIKDQIREDVLTTCRRSTEETAL